MRNKALFLTSLVLSLVCSAFAQTEAVKNSLVPGDVVSLTEKQIVIKTKDGQLSVDLSPKTEFKKIAPERPSIASAVPATLSEIVVGDKVIASGVYSDDKSKLAA